MNSTLHERLASALSARGVKPSQLARQIGVSPQSVTYWLKGTTVPKRQHVASICALLQINWQWLEKGTGTMSGNESGKNVTLSGTEHFPELGGFDTAELVKVPLVKLDSITVQKENFTHEPVNSDSGYVVAMFPVGKRSFAFVMQNKSMEPAVELGDVIVIDPDAELRPGDLVVVHLAGIINKNIFRRYSFGTNGEIFLSPTNLAYETLKFSPEEWARHAKLVGVMTELTKPRRT